jgi:iron complex outermembrane receptor protein
MVPISKTANHRRRILMAASALSPIMFSAAAAAQDLPPEPESVEEIIVTGSNIRGKELSAPVPVQVIGRSEIESFGTAQFSDIFKAIPSNSGSEAFTEAQPRGGNSQFNLRGLGYTSTLTLINGRRAGVSPVSDDTGADYVDINQFPLSMIGRVEVLKDGASAIYGSDAVAGVVNIITRKGFDGIELSGGIQDATNRSYNLNLALGKKFDRGSFNLYATYYNQTGNFRSDFDWLMERVGGNGVPGKSQFLNTNGAPSSYRRATRNAGGLPVVVSGAQLFADPDCEAAGGVFAISDSGTVNRNQCNINFLDQVSIIPRAERIQAFAEFEYELLDGVKFFGELSASRNTLTSARGPGSFSNGAAANPVGSIFIPGSHPFNFFKADPANAGRLVYVGPENWNPAVDTAVDLVASSRVFGAAYYGKNAGERVSKTSYLRAVGGLEIELPNDWRATTSYQIAYADFSDEQDYRYRADALNAALLNGTLNPFGTAISRPDLISPKNGVSRAGNSQTVLDQVLSTSIDTSQTTQSVVDGVLTGNMFDLPAGPVGVAFGGQYRKLTLRETPDSLQSSGRGDNRNGSSPFRGTQDVIAAYAEAAVPVASFADLQLAVRYESYGGSVGSSVDPKLAVRVTPIQGLSFRGSVSTSFQAPSLRQTATTITRSFLNDPVTVVNGQSVCGPTSSVNATISTSGSDDLKPQSATNYNVGIVAQPVRGLSFSIDYWRYDYKDLIASGANPQSILDRDCADDGIPNDPRVVRTNGLIDVINTAYVNVGEVKTDGIDVSATYGFGIEGLANFQISADVTYINKFAVRGGEGGSFDGVGSRNISNNFRTMPRWRGVGTLAFDRGPLSGALTMRYIDGYKNDQSNNAPISSYTTFDASLSYELKALGLSQPTVLTIGADNIFDRNPPELRRYDVNGNFLTGQAAIDRPGYDAYSGADIRGRILYARFKQTF